MFFRVSLLVCHKTVCTLVQTHPCVIQSDFVIPYHAGGGLCMEEVVAGETRTHLSAPWPPGIGTAARGEETLVLQH